jgi:hypothetical protein
MGINDKKARERFALAKYCELFQLDVSDFLSVDETEKPDIQSTNLGIGIEETSGLLSGEHKIWGEAENQEKNRNEYDKQQKLIEELDNKFWSVSDPCQQEQICKLKCRAIENKCKAGEKIVFACFTSNITAPESLLKIVRGKTKKLNKEYKTFNINALFINFLSNTAGENCLSLCGIDKCDVTLCEKCDKFDCENCAKPDKHIGCRIDDLNSYEICTVGAFVRVLKNANFEDKLKFNPIILCQLEQNCLYSATYNISTGKVTTHTVDQNPHYRCWIIDTDKYTIVEHRETKINQEGESK